MAEVADFHWHDLRHTFASRLIMGGVDLRSVGELLGHKTLVMVMRYSHLAPEHLREAVNRLVPARSRRKQKPELAAMVAKQPVRARKTTTVN